MTKTPRKKLGARTARALRAKLQWSQETEAAFLGYNVSTIRRWEAGEVPLPAVVQRLLELELKNRRGMAKRPAK